MHTTPFPLHDTRIIVVRYTFIPTVHAFHLLFPLNQSQKASEFTMFNFTMPSPSNISFSTGTPGEEFAVRQSSSLSSHRKPETEFWTWACAQELGADRWSKSCLSPCLQDSAGRYCEHNFPPGAKIPGPPCSVLPFVPCLQMQRTLMQTCRQRSDSRRLNNLRAPISWSTPLQHIYDAPSGPRGSISGGR